MGIGLYDLYIHKTHLKVIIKPYLKHQILNIGIVKFQEYLNVTVLGHIQKSQAKIFPSTLKHYKIYNCEF